ncbi:MAG TPA: helix-turn-helix transcriptional regulator [Thermoanaerobaculia bacterium]|nr:helix-turn-helix transcriptional regulator [Thermoanaerobaculia bacterium]
MAYKELQPTPALRPWVECFWIKQPENTFATDVHRVLPDGCADLVFDLSDGENDVVGTMTRPLLMPGNHTSEYLGVRFRPGCAAAFLRIPLSEITDARVPLADVWKNWDGRIDVPSLEAELLRRLAPDRDRRVMAAVARLVQSAGALRIDELANEIGISRQHLARQFLQQVGVSPKTLARVLRFRRVVASLERAPEVEWADAALQHGYYDQSHLIADFRELAGTTPNAFLFSNR